MPTLDDADTDHIPVPAGHAPRLDAIQTDDGLGLVERDNATAALFSTVTVDAEAWR